jgi:glycosyltransferase involved in cell wall biosynthesis
MKLFLGMNGLLSVVIAALNNEATIGRTLSSVSSNKFPKDNFEVILVDNGSTDNTVQVAKRYPVKIYSYAKRGQGAARNFGVTKARGEIICFTDSDVVVAEDWLERISDFFRNHPYADGVGGPIFAPLREHVNDLQKLEGELYAKTHDFPKCMMKCEFREKRNALYSANCAYRRNVLVSSGGFDESGLDAVDIDLCWKLILRGKRLMFDPELKAFHLGFPSSLKGVFKQQFRWGESEARLKMKYSDSSGLRRKILSYYFVLLSFLCVFYSKRRTMSLLHFFENCAFNCGFVNAHLKAYRRH